MANRIQLVEPGYTNLSGTFHGVKFTNGVSDDPVSVAQENVIAANVRAVIFGSGLPAGGAANPADFASSNPAKTRNTKEGSTEDKAVMVAPNYVMVFAPNGEEGVYPATDIGLLAVPKVKQIMALPYALLPSDHGHILIYSGASSGNITVPEGLGLFAATVVARGTGMITFVADGVVLAHGDDLYTTEKANLPVSVLATAHDNLLLLGRTA